MPHTPASLRVARGMRQAQVAKIAGVSPASIARYERDGGDGLVSPRMDTVEKVAKALGVEPEVYTAAMRQLRSMASRRRSRKAGVR